MNILSRLREIKALPALPEVVSKVHAIFNSPDGEARTAARIIEQDVAISAILMRAANSAYYNPGGKRVSSVQRAIVRLGFSEVESIITAVGLISKLSHAQSNLDYTQFWRHSLSCAYLCRLIGSRCDRTANEEKQQSFFLGGLMHDLGILILDQFFPKVFHELTYSMRMEDVSYLTAEKTQLQHHSHPMIGGVLLELWGIDSLVVNMVRGHHDPASISQNYMKDAAIVYCAEYMLCNWNVGSFEGHMGDLNESYLDSIGISHDSLVSLYDKVKSEVELSEIIQYAMQPRSESYLLRKI